MEDRVYQEKFREDQNGYDVFWVQIGYLGDLMVGKLFAEGKGFRKVISSYCFRGRGNWFGIFMGQDECVYREEEACYVKSLNC